MECIVNAHGSDGGARNSGWETTTSEPSPLAVFAALMNGIIFALVVHADAADSSMVEADGSKV